MQNTAGVFSYSIGQFFLVCASGYRSGLSIELSYTSLPIFDAAVEYAEMGFVPAGAYSNRSFVGDNAALDGVPRAYQDILFDPQTSGGLVISVAPKDAERLYAELCIVLENTVCGKPAIIGTVVERIDRVVRVNV